MKITLHEPVEKIATHIVINVPILFRDDELPNGEVLPGEKDGRWHARINLDTGVIEGWPAGKEMDLHITARDAGSYSLVDAAGATILELDEEYVPNGIIPGFNAGDTLELKIDGTGKVTNWPRTLDASDFLKDQEQR